jgi:hypothetical protein
MAFDDFMDPEVGIAVAATAMIFSPRVRNVLRRGAVYSLAGVLRAGDAVSSAARGAAAEVQRTAAAGAEAAQQTATEPRSTARGGRGGRSAQSEQP